MILITKNSVNQFVVTLQERRTLTNPYYLFSFLSHQTKDTTNVICPILSSNSRYDLFEFTETGSTANLTAGTTSLQEGFYTYNVYETLSTDLQTSGKTLLEKGVLLVSGSTPQIVYTADTTNLNYIIYNQ